MADFAILFNYLSSFLSTEHCTFSSLQYKPLRCFKNQHDNAMDVMIEGEKDQVKEKLHLQVTKIEHFMIIQKMFSRHELWD